MLEDVFQPIPVQMDSQPVRLLLLPLLPPPPLPHIHTLAPLPRHCEGICW